MWWSKVNLLLCEWVFDFVREDTRRKTRDDFLCPFDMSSVENIVIDQHVVAEESHLQGVRSHTTEYIYPNLPLSVREEATHYRNADQMNSSGLELKRTKGSQMDDMSGLVLLK
jgi:urate oxidase